jgi:hypothetical protein
MKTSLRPSKAAMADLSMAILSMDFSRRASESDENLGAGEVEGDASGGLA